MEGADRTVRLPEDLCRRVEEVCGRKEGESFDALLERILHLLVADRQASLTDEEEALLLQQLRDLGYAD